MLFAFVSFLLICIYLFDHTDSSWMLLQSHFSALQEAIHVRCADCDDNNMQDGGLNAGLKIEYYHL